MLRFALALVLLAGCPVPDTDDAPSETGEVAECDTIQERAAELVQAQQACTAAVGCEALAFADIVGGNSCFAAFQCSNAFPTGADLTAFVEDAAALAAEQEAGACGDCRDDVLCAPPEDYRAECNESTGRCEIVME